MIAVYLSPLYILINIYIARWLLRWMHACSHHFGKTWVRAVVVTVYSFLALSMLIAFFLPTGHLRRFMKLLGNYWLGVSLYMVLTVVLVDLLRILLTRCRRVNQEKLGSRRTFVLVGTLCIVLIASVCTGGALNARYIHTTKYEVQVEKDGGRLDELKVVLVADLHMGYNIGCLHMQQMVERINAQKPDLVVIAGDIFDNEYEALDDPERLAQILGSIRSKYGVYACYGNHDIEEPILAGFTFGSRNEKKESDIRMDELLENAGITLLQDEGVLIEDSFYLYGRPDAHKPGRGIDTRKTPAELVEGMDRKKPVLVIDHEPSQLQELSEAGVDVDLCGHTHDGQLFPMNLTSRLMWKNSRGLLKVGSMSNIVTSGVGLFGANMRVATISEVCSITVRFE